MRIDSLFLAGHPPPRVVAWFSRREAAFDGLIWFAAVGGVVAAAIVVVAYLRRRIRTRDGRRSPPFTLEELGQLQRQGDISDAEFDSLKRKMLEGI